jgi:hypothetical protein
MSITTKTVGKILAKVAGTVVLALGFIVLAGRAPFLASTPDSELSSEYSGPTYSLDPPFQTGNMLSPVLPEISSNGAALDMGPSLGLFNAQFAGVDGAQGFSTNEYSVPGECVGAGRRLINTECPGCVPFGDGSDATDMLLWHQPRAGNTVVRAVSRDCISFAGDGTPVVGSITFGDGDGIANGAVSLSDESTVNDGGNVPLLAGATRMAALSLGSWSATYDSVARPSSALRDMTNALQGNGWREVSDPEVVGLETFAGQRVFTNNMNEICVISLSGDGGTFQLVTVINSRA